MNKAILIGNSFPLSLIRRAVKITPCPLAELTALLPEAKIVSFWGHSNTLAAVNSLLGYDLTPEEQRPVLGLSANNLPRYADNDFTECWVLSPDYYGDFRPAIGEDVPPEKIKSWQCLKVTFV